MYGFGSTALYKDGRVMSVSRDSLFKQVNVFPFKTH